MNRALPGWAIDLIRDGARRGDLKAKGNRAVWAALVRTATSAQMRGQDRMEWEAVVLEPGSHLGTQVRLKDGHRARNSKAVAKTLSDAWEAAWEWRTQQPRAWDAQEVAQVALERAKAVMDLVADPETDLTDSQRAILAYAAEETRKRGLLRVALPRRDLIAVTGLGLTALRTALRGLEAGGLLSLAEAGKPGGPKAREARANLYALPDLSMSRGTRPVVPSTQTCGALTDQRHGAPLHTCGASHQEATPQHCIDTTSKELTMVRFIRYPDGRMVLESEDPQVALLALQQGTAQIQITEVTSEDLPENVIPLRAAF